MKPKPLDLNEYWKTIKHEEKIFHVWHYCLKCGRVLIHSTGTMTQHVQFVMFADVEGEK